MNIFRWAKIVLDRKLNGQILPAASHLMESQPVQYRDGFSYEEVENFINQD